MPILFLSIAPSVPSWEKGVIHHYSSLSAATASAAVRFVLQTMEAACLKAAVSSEHARSPAEERTKQIQYFHQTAHILVFESQGGAEIAQVGKHRNRLKNRAGKSRNPGRRRS